MFPIKIDDHIELRLIEAEHTQLMLDVIQANREHLDQWLRWSGRIQTFEDAHGWVKRFVDKFEAKDGFHAGIWLDGVLVGGLLCHSINHASHKTEIGYWLAANATGHGLATKASRAAMNFLFDVMDIHRIEIQSGIDNKASRAIPERLGFTLEGIKRESEWVTTRYVDHAIYSMLAPEWKALNGG